MNSLQKEELLIVNAFIEEADEEQQESLKHTFKITDLSSLNWAFRKVQALKTNQSEVKRLADGERERISFWEQKELSSIDDSLSFFEGLIYEYHNAVLSENPKAKTLSTPYGKAKARMTKAQPEKVNEELILQHVIESNMDEFIKQSVKWGDLKKSLKIVEVEGKKAVIDENGQVVPGVEVKPEGITFSMEVE
jgi:hypothetical protein